MCFDSSYHQTASGVQPQNPQSHCVGKGGQNKPASSGTRGSAVSPTASTGMSV